MKTEIVLIGLLSVLGVTVAGVSYFDQEIEATNLQQRIFEDVINSTINAIVDRLKPLDPVQIDEARHSVRRHDISVENVTVAGFSDVRATHIKLSGLISWRLELVLEAPRVSGSAERWRVEGQVFYGNGSASAEIENLKVSISAKVNAISMRLSEVRVVPSVGRANVRVTGIYNDPELSQQLSDNATDFLNNIGSNKQLHEKIGQIVEKAINAILG